MSWACFASPSWDTSRRHRRRLTCMKQEKAPCVILPGFGNKSDDYLEFVKTLEGRGHRCYVVPVKRSDWWKTFKGLLMLSYWTGELEPNAVLDWYFDSVRNTMQEAEEKESDGFNIIGHSAGGWLGRIYLHERIPVEKNQLVKTLITLGTPHLPPPKNGFDQTRGLLTYVNTRCDNNHRKEVSYVCVGGKALQGKKWSQGKFEEWVAYQSYGPVCGDGAAWGDGITPLESAFLEDAERIVIDGALHSPVSAPSSWYGSEGLIDKWIHHLQ
mmetsp:Transcript_11507/g.16607  ORF Transcript_11507/g.16607 Transcript_11507/m.16607 type:complete len:270 (-) Transcript_11507:1038-1847(-)